MVRLVVGFIISGVCSFFFHPKKFPGPAPGAHVVRFRGGQELPGARVFSAGCFFSFFFLVLLHSMICIVGLLELHRVFHRREFVSFLTHNDTWRRGKVLHHIASYPLFSFLYFVFFYLSFVLWGGC